MSDMCSAQVLVVEDEETAAKVVGAEVNDLGFPVQIAHTGEAAINVLDTQEIIAVILDLRLRDSAIQGLQLLDWIREHHTEVPVVVTTAHPHLAARALEKGAANVLTKPVEVRFIVRLIEKEINLINTRTQLSSLEKEIRFYRNKYSWLSLFIILVMLLMLGWGIAAPGDVFGRGALLY
jgi:two-component system, NtrC family, nitrogen regulation response regulator NtrX